SLLSSGDTITLRPQGGRAMRNYYADPTANTAIANVDRERRREEHRRQEAERRACQNTEQGSGKEKPSGTRDRRH
ncbi:MAG: hypothetical protein J6A79_04655, partial [Clostridia bacterium]|nr:hypothetical protein [Clostridia bacterium]